MTYIIKVWANRLIAGTKVWDDVPENRREEVNRELQKRLSDKEITMQRYYEIIGVDSDEDGGMSG